MNRVILIGNLTRDPEAGQTASSISYCRFSIAVNRRFGKDQNEVDYFNVVTWRGLADTCAKFLSKGRKVCVSGSLQIRNYEAQDGTKRTSVEVIADDIEFLTPKQEEQPTQKDAGETGFKLVAEYNDLPF